MSLCIVPPLRSHADEAALVGAVLFPPLQVRWVLAPTATEVDRAEAADEDPQFVVHLDRPLTSDERRVVRRDVPQVTLHGESDATLSIALSPSRVAADPNILGRTVAAISTVAPTLDQVDAKLFAVASSAAAAVTRLLAA